MPQYPIPQFIEEEARIIFFLTFRQFFLLVGGGAICFILYFALPFYLFLISSLFVMLLTGAIAFVKINNRSVVKIFLDFLGFSMARKNYVWKKREPSYSPKMQKGGVKNIQEIIVAKTDKSGVKKVELKK